MDEVGFLGETREGAALKAADFTSDGVVSMNRSQMAEAEMVRDGIWEGYKNSQRDDMLRRSKESPAILNGWSVTPLEDRLLVRMASFREGYVCESCSGLGYREGAKCERCLGASKMEVEDSRECIRCLGSGIFEGNPCGNCGGSGKLVRGTKKIDCPACRIVGADAHEPRSCGFQPCPMCAGTGLKDGVIAVPDESKQDHSYGDVIAVGEGVRDLRNGDRVLFSKMAGIYIRGTIGGCVLLRRGEVMGYMRKA